MVPELIEVLLTHLSNIFRLGLFLSIAVELLLAVGSAENFEMQATPLKICFVLDLHMLLHQMTM